MNLKFFFLTILISFSYHFSFGSNIYGQGLDGKTFALEGYILDQPRFHSGYNGKYQSWTFTLNSKPTRQFGDEFISVSFHTVKWGKTVGTFNLKKGDHVTLTGTYREAKIPSRTSGIVGSFKVNDLSLEEVKGK